MLLTPTRHRAAARESLNGAERPGRIILLHTGAIMLISLLLTLVDHLLEQLIATTGGLSGLGTRAILSTAQYILRLLPMILLPFWQLGYTYYTLRVARNQESGKADLLEGFRRFGPVLRLKLLTGVLTVGLALVSSYVASFIFALTPWADPLVAELGVLLKQELTDEALAEAILSIAPDRLLPLMIIYGLCLLAGGVMLFFHFRLAELWLMDHPGSGALVSLLSSRRLMHGSWKGMLKIDLSFWWFFLLELLVSVLGMGDTILNYLGISMTTDTFVTYLIFFCLYLWAHLMLYWWKKNLVSVTYAHAYLALCPEEADETTKV